MTLKEKQFLFAKLQTELIQYMRHKGYQPVMGKTYACLCCSCHHKNSLHRKCLAIDVELHDKNGKYLTKTEDHAPFGEWWKKRHPLCRWGGDFSDGNHYSITHGNMK